MDKKLHRILSLVLVLTLVCTFLPVVQPVIAAAESDLSTGNVAYGKSVAFSCGGEVTADGDYGIAAIRAGLSVLTDGVAHSPNWWVNNGNPYVALKSAVVQGPYVFSVDLGGTYDLEQVRLYSYSRQNWSIYPLEAVRFTTSLDGNTWTELGSVELIQAGVKTVADPRYENSFVDIYEFSLSVSAAGRYVRATFDNNAYGLVGIGEFEVYGQKAASLITGTSISYFGHGTEVGSDANWGSTAVKAGLSVLTDGIGNCPNWWVNSGNPNIGLKSSVLPGPYVFNLDLGGACSINRISAYFYSRTDWGVDAPDGVSYSVSNDGIHWTQVGLVKKANATTTVLTDERNPGDQSPTIYTFTFRMVPMDARYVKMTFDTNALGMIGLQELQVHGVKKSITNLALGKLASTKNYTYQVTGGGTGYESTGTKKPDGTRYTVTEVENASVSRLTDGTVINGSKVSYPSNWSSQAWNSTGTIMSQYLQIYRNDSRIITLDLGAVRNVTGIRMHFAALEAQGFYMPTNVTYYLSADGENYYEVADVWNHQVSADGNDSNISGTDLRHGWYAASGISYNARYVKLIFPVNVYILSDELQVWGCEELSTSAPALDTCPKYDPLEKYVGHFADGAQTGGVRNEFMAYSGWYINSDGSEVYNTYKTVKEYMTSIAYIDANGEPQDWLFDDHTVMSHYYTSRGTFNSYKAGYTSGKYYANQRDWYEWLCYAFGKDAAGNDLSYDGNSLINLEALEEATRIAKDKLNDPDYKVGVKLVLFPAVEYQEDWGYIDGQHIDFTISGCGSQEQALANRTKAYQWYIDQAVAMWEAAGFQHLELTGFYYYEETIHESTDRIAKAATQALTDIVHTHVTPTTNTKPAFDSRVGGRLYIYQLPFYQSEGYWNWAEYGFDYALMQPNYSFYDMYTLTQLKECAELCTYYGLGMQMEFGGTASTAYHQKFEDYLNYGKEYGYQSAVVSWYMSTWGCYSMAYNSNNTRYLYDMVYDFVKGQTIAQCSHPIHGTNGRCTNCAAEVEHTYVDGSCVCGSLCPHETHGTDGICLDCRTVVGHSYENGICSCGDAQIVGSGQCGDDAYWTQDAAGNVIITGTGDMWDFGVYSNEAPWNNGQKVIHVQIGSGITSVGDYAFYRSIDLAQVELPRGLVHIGEGAFYYCEKLTEISLPASLTALERDAFGYCTALQKIIIPAGVTEIPHAAFSSCYALAEVELPDSLTKIGAWAFSHCKALPAIRIPSGVNEIGEQAFSNCYSLAEVNLPKGIETVPSNCFNGCAALSAIEIPDSVIRLEEHCFHGSGLRSVTIPASVTVIGENAFSYCELLQEVTLVPGNLEKISDYAFFNCSVLTAMNIPEGVKTVGDYCFHRCYVMTEISLPDSLTGLGFSALRECHSLIRVTIPRQITALADYLLHNAESLRELNLPEGLESIGEYALSYCGSLTGLELPQGVTKIGAMAFGEMASLQRLELPAGVREMGGDVFAGCTALTEVVWPEAMTTIPGYTFQNCVGLKEVTIPAYVENVGGHAFQNCSGLERIIFEGDAPVFGGDVFAGVTAVAEYPASGKGWTEDVKQQYGGAILWRMVGVVIPNLEMDYPTLSFEGEVMYNLYYNVDDMTSVVEMGLITFAERLYEGTMADAVRVYPGYSGADGSYMSQTAGIPAKELGDTVFFKVYAKLSDGSYVYSEVVGYHAMAYAKSILKNSSNEHMKRLVIAMINYGAEAQKFFNYNTESLMNSFLTEEQQAMISAYDASMIAPLANVDSAKVGMFTYNQGDFARRYNSVSFDGAFSINYYFTAKGKPDNGMKFYYWNLADYNAATVLTPENATGTMDMVEGENYQFWGQVPNIAAKQVDETVFVAGVYELDGVTYTTGILAYSLGKYCQKIAADDTSDQQAFSAATAVYGYYAKEYFANI